ncbi:hypothetical protein [Thiorhodovibrio winogradskyi]|uniref:hypothetical protein n=1 Tax=Thiorhodovibrio winogradskyi TaxID=77007 RepID=UPI002E29C3DC|nr:hypothetical protein [Thiorhodovibrio winogradskyi]
MREAKTTRRYANKFVGLTRRDDTTVWVLAHVEVQGDQQSAFAERMFTYNYKIRDAYFYFVNFIFLIYRCLHDVTQSFAGPGCRHGFSNPQPTGHDSNTGF